MTPAPSSRTTLRAAPIIYLKETLMARKNLTSSTDPQGVTTYWSYGTRIAIDSPFTGLVVSQNYWSVTTAKHLTQVDGGSKEAKARRLSASEFERQVDMAYLWSTAKAVGVSLRTEDQAQVMHTLLQDGATPTVAAGTAVLV